MAETRQEMMFVQELALATEKAEAMCAVVDDERAKRSHQARRYQELYVAAAARSRLSRLSADAFGAWVAAVGCKDNLNYSSSDDSAATAETGVFLTGEEFSC
mmetsp:Transcript_100358/g.259188  ORF Transcript_100358/g.259188 Transcript_100358/m.259188 type:complete len:102 (-) Transcript_100358:252-557(-)